MANIIPDLSVALSSLEEVKLRQDVPIEYRQPVIHLTKKLKIHIIAYEAHGHDHVDEAIVPEIKRRTLHIQEAALGRNFDGLLRHGFAMMEALPGPHQSRPKRPRPR